MQQMQLSIPEPCHENWDAMAPSEQGRFCNACAKQVVDFSNMSDAEVLNYFSTITTEKVCGRAYPDQLERTISMPKEIKKRKFWYWNYITMLLLFFSKTNNTKAQNKRMTTGSVQKVSADQLNVVRTTNINDALAGKVGEVAINQNSVINGVVKDINGDPIPFASVRIKKSNTGLNADANGAFSLKVNVAKDTIVISAASFKPMEVTLQGLKNYEFKLEKDPNPPKEEYIVARAGGISFRRMPEKTYSKYTLTFNVKDNATLQQVSKASLIIAKTGKDKIDTVLTNSKGVFKLDKVRRDENYIIKVIADGYDDQELEINARYFNEKKINKEILLHKKPVVVQPASRVRLMGNVSSTLRNTDVLYVVDGTITTKAVADAIGADNIEDVSVLQGPAAAALFGPYGSNGAIIINTKKKQQAVYKSLDTVAVKSYGSLKRTTVTGAVSAMGGMIPGVCIRATVKDSVKTMVLKAVGALKVYPDPVQRGNAFTVALKLKMPGDYIVQVVNETGRILLQQQVVASIKELTATIPTDMQWSSGVYFVRVLDKKASLIITDKIVIR
ncbi:carboxypeptidase-like regulatory domain-containing protein [Ferruginibacter sp.]